MDSTRLSVLIAIIVAAVAVASYRLHRRADKRAELKEGRENPRLTLRLREAATELGGDPKYRIWRFSLLVTNQSDCENSVVHARCRISYRTSGSHTRNVHTRNVDICNVDVPVYAGHGDNLCVRVG